MVETDSPEALWKNIYASVLRHANPPASPEPPPITRPPSPQEPAANPFLLELWSQNISLQLASARTDLKQFSLLLSEYGSNGESFKSQLAALEALIERSITSSAQGKLDLATVVQHITLLERSLAGIKEQIQASQDAVQTAIGTELHTNSTKQVSRMEEQEKILRNVAKEQRQQREMLSRVIDMLQEMKEKDVRQKQTASRNESAVLVHGTPPPPVACRSGKRSLLAENSGFLTETTERKDDMPHAGLLQGVQVWEGTVMESPEYSQLTPPETGDDDGVTDTATDEEVGSDIDALLP